MIGDAKGSHWRGPQSFMHAAEIVMSHVQADSRNVASGRLLKPLERRANRFDAIRSDKFCRST